MEESMLAPLGPPTDEARVGQQTQAHPALYSAAAVSMAEMDYKATAFFYARELQMVTSREL